MPTSWATTVGDLVGAGLQARLDPGQVAWPAPPRLVWLTTPSKRLAGRGDGPVDVGRGPLGDGGHDLFGRGVDDLDACRVPAEGTQAPSM